MSERYYDTAYKQNIAEIAVVLIESKKPLTGLSISTGVASSTIHKWVKAYKAGKLKPKTCNEIKLDFGEKYLKSIDESLKTICGFIAKIDTPDELIQIMKAEFNQPGK